MKIVTLTVVILFISIFTSCSNVGKQADNAALPNQAIIEKNKQTAVLNEVGAAVRDAQSVEKFGRDMESYRLAQDAESKRTCQIVMEKNQSDLTDLQTKISKLPENYQTQLSPIIPDLNQCVSCQKNAMESCVKARASINQIIKQLYP